VGLEAAVTCIVGVIGDDGCVHVGGDSAGVSGWDLTIRSDRKVFAKDGFVFGFTSSFRMGQVLRHSFTPPKRHPDTPLDQYMVTEFIDAVRACLKAAGFAKVNNQVESGGTFIVGHAGRLFCVEDDFQVAEAAGRYMACGCGAAVAHGALFASAAANPVDRIFTALRAAEAHSAGVRGPFVTESVEVVK
jgi:hypothetical protein